jgi:hypothetical protein
MFHRRHKLITQQAVIWLMAVLFVMPGTFSTVCCCSAVHGCFVSVPRTPCHCDDHSISTLPSAAEDSGGCLAIFATQPPHILQSCPCSDNCPCRCHEGGEQPVQQLLIRSTSREEFSTGSPLAEAIGFVDSNRHAPVALCPEPAMATSALQRCISLSRFTI